MKGAKPIALFLGAGASKAFKFPLTKDILPIIMDKLEAGRLFGKKSTAAAKYRKELTRFLKKLLPGIWKRSAGPVAITDLLSLIDHMILTSSVPFPGADAGTLSSIRMLLERAIFEALDWPYDPGAVQTVPPGLKVLAKWIQDVGLRTGCAIVSTNYDECVETEVYRWVGTPEEVNRKIDFGMTWRERKSGQIFHSIPDANYGIFKLHGSVGWLKCELCNLITCHDEYVFHTTPFAALSYLDGSLTDCICGHSPLRSVMVAPSTVRDIRDMNLLSVWRSAFEALRAADRWFIIGYSMPTEDVAIRSMLIRAYNGRKVKPVVEVIQHRNDVQTRSRYEVYFPSCVYRSYGMQGFVKRIQQGLI